ncbi:MAG: AMP-binding protein [Candidatus Dormibacteraeota bacterium]|nr:AMP-binding protein [Candidatus Dormibacteraeota bacterium]
MPDILSVHAAQRPEAIALVAGSRQVSYAELNNRACRAGSMFQALGVGSHGRVAVQALNSVAGFEIASGLRKLAAVGVPVNFRLRGPELAYILNDSGARVICAGAEFVPGVEEVRAELTALPVLIALDGHAPAGWLTYDAVMRETPAIEPASDIDPGIGASMIYTSGTTGHPKGAYRPTGVKLESVLEAIQLFELRPDDVHLFAGPGYHSAPGYFNALHIALGAMIVIMERFDATEALRLIERHHVTTTFMAPTLLHRLVDVPDAASRRHDTSSLRALILGGAPCPFSLKQRAMDRFGEVLWEFYGATETGISLVLRPDEQLAHPGSVGRVTPNYAIRLTDPDGRDVAEGEPGELWVRSTNQAMYHNRPEANAAALRDGFFTVGDIAYRDPEGYYHICDRKIDMIISGGVNIYPAEVEVCLHAHPAVKDVAVIGVPDEEWGEAVKALVVLRPGHSASTDALIAWCRGRIATYKCPRSIEFVTELPRDLAGKLLKRTIREPYWAGAGRRI